MKQNSSVLGGAVGIIAIAVLCFGFVIVRPALAQEDATSWDQAVESTPPVDTVSSPDASADQSNSGAATPAEISTSASENTWTTPAADSAVPVENTDTSSTRYYAHVTDGVVYNLLVDPNHIIPTGALGDPSTWIPAGADVGIGYTYNEGTFAPYESQKTQVFISSTSTPPQGSEQ